MTVIRLLFGVLALIATHIAQFGIANADESKLIPLTIAEYGEYPLYTALYVADAEKFFEKEGLAVKIVPAGGDEKVFAALLSGDAQFGVSDPTFVAISGERGRPGRVVAAILQNVPAWGIAKDSKVPQISHPEELKGFKVATYSAPSTSYTLQKRMFQTGGLEPSIVGMPYGALLSALDAGRVDIALENEPNVSLGTKQGARIVYSLSDYYPQFAFTGLMVLPEYLQKNADSVQRVVNAFRRANLLIEKNPKRAIEIVARRFPELPSDVVDKAIRNVIGAKTFAVNGMFTEQAWNTAIQLRREVGDLKQDAPYTEYVVSKFAETAKSIE